VVRGITARAATDAASAAMKAESAGRAESILRESLLAELPDASELLDGLPVPEASTTIQG
jgi:hypothetical protein